MRGILVSIGLIMFAASAQAAVWKSVNKWDAGWEDRYSRWVETNYDEDIFTKGRYGKIATDCADSVYLARVMFAYENQLPFVILDPTGGRGKITNRMSRFDKYSKKKRIRKFMNFVSDIVSTKSLPRDTYPVAINRDWVRPGGVWARPRIRVENFLASLFGIKVSEEPGHADLIKEVNEAGVVYMIGSTVPRAVRTLNVTSNLFFLPENHDTGIRYWYQPTQYGKPLASLDGYSLDQFNIGYEEPDEDEDGILGDISRRRSLSAWQSEVYQKLALRAEGKEEALYRLAGDYCTMIKARVSYVKKGVKYRSKIGARCMNDSEYDSYSTPSRDKRAYGVLKKIAKMGTIWGRLSDGAINKLAPYFEPCGEIEYAPGKSISLAEAARRMKNGQLSSDPNVSLGARWGEYDEKSTCDKPY